MSAAIRNLQPAQIPLSTADITNIVQLSLDPADRKLTLAQLTDFVLTTGLSNGDFNVGASGEVTAAAGNYMVDSSGNTTQAGYLSILSDKILYMGGIPFLQMGSGGYPFILVNNPLSYRNFSYTQIASLDNAGNFSAASLAAADGFTGTLAAAISSGKSVVSGIIIN